MAKPAAPAIVSGHREDRREANLRRFLTGLFDAAWYRQRYPDVVAAGLDPLLHFIRFGVAEKRDPNRVIAHLG